MKLDEHDQHCLDLYEQFNATRKHVEATRSKPNIEAFLIEKIDELQGAVIMILTSEKITSQQKIKLKNSWSLCVKLIAALLDPKVIETLIFEKSKEAYQKKVLSE